MLVHLSLVVKWATQLVAGNPLELQLLSHYRNVMVAKTTLGYSENVEDWAISSVFSKSAMIGYEKHSETERLWVFYDGSSILRMLKIQSGLLRKLEEQTRASRIPTKLFLKIFYHLIIISLRSMKKLL